MASVNLQDVSLKFRRHTGRSTGIKESIIQLFHKPPWYRTGAMASNEFWGVKGVTFALREGDRLGIIGQNGAGKSTVLKIISRIYTPTLGNVTTQGRIAPLIELGAGFHPELTGRENAFLNGAVLGIKRKVIQERMESIVEFSELADFIDMPMKYYSTGMHLKLAFTLATEIPPDILILDELYAGGDLAFIQKANQRLDRFMDQSKVLILVAHNMEYIQRFCNRVIVLHRGQMIFQGGTAEGIARYLAVSSSQTDFVPSSAPQSTKTLEPGSLVRPGSIAPPRATDRGLDR